jgi:hypothetical protein
MNEGTRSVSGLVAGAGRIAELLRQRAAGDAPPEGVRLRRGRWLVPTVVGIALDPSDAAAYRVTDNRVSELGGWVDELLVEALQEAQAAPAGLDGVGFTSAEFEQFIATASTRDRWHHHSTLTRRHPPPWVTNST